MSKITSEHLARAAFIAAFIYVRQSTAYQVVNNPESQRRQYGLVERARRLGWDDVELVGEDLGRSGGGTVRPGFEKLLAAICEGRVGAVVGGRGSPIADTADTADTACRAQRAEIEAFNIAGETELARLGMIVNTADSAGIRGRLSDFYARWKARSDPAAWAQLESHAGGFG